MTIGPAPMIRIEEMSVRLGMSLGAIRAQKKGALFARPSAAQRLRPRARALFRPESPGREGRPQNNGVKRGRPDNMRCSRPPRDEGHARLVVADIGGSAARRKSAGGELGDHRRLAIDREPKIEAQAPVLGDKRAQAADERSDEKPVRGAKENDRERIVPGRDMGLNDIAQGVDAVPADEPEKQNE